MLFTLMFFFFNDTATTEIYTLSLHDALPISDARHVLEERAQRHQQIRLGRIADEPTERLLGEAGDRSEEHTSELQSLRHLVCRLLLEKKKMKLHSVCHLQTE